MLHLLDDYLLAKNQRDCWISSRDIDDQRILQSDWMRDQTGHTQTKVVVSDTNFFGAHFHEKNLRDNFILSRDIDNQRIM